MRMILLGFSAGIIAGLITDVIAYLVRRRKLVRKNQAVLQEILQDEDGKCQQCITTCIACSAVECFKKELASLKCVQAGWAFGVPEDAREQWLDLIVKVMRKYC